MEINIFAGTQLGYAPTKEELDHIGGYAAGVCYLKGTIKELLAEPIEKTQKREAMIKESGHKSPFDHPSISFEFIDMPKIVAMILNDEQMYVTSEKSGRYKRMPLPEDENEAYEKWLSIFQGEIDKLRSTAPEWFDDKKIGKLAQENARYLTSVFTPTSMIYTMTYRQINIIYRKFEKEIDVLAGKDDLFSKMLRPALIDFNQQMQKMGYIDEKLSIDDKNYVLKLFNRTNREVKEQFGECYTFLYSGSFAQLAQAHRHRTIDYSIKMKYFDKEQGYYVPPILKGTGLEKMWLEDCERFAERFPQGRLVPIVERGTFENFVAKTQERNCALAQLEIDNQTAASRQKYYEHLQVENPELAETLKPYNKGSRCTAGFKCPTPCHYKDGVTGERTV